MEYPKKIGIKKIIRTISISRPQFQCRFCYCVLFFFSIFHLKTGHSSGFSTWIPTCRGMNQRSLHFIVYFNDVISRILVNLKEHFQRWQWTRWIGCNAILWWQSSTVLFSPWIWRVSFDMACLWRSETHTVVVVNSLSFLIFTTRMNVQK